MNRIDPTSNLAFNEFYQKSARQLIQKGALSAALGSIGVGLFLGLIFLKSNTLSVLVLGCLSVILVSNFNRLLLAQNTNLPDVAWIKQIRLTHLVVCISYCTIFMDIYVNHRINSTIVLSYIVLNSLVAAAVFWFFMIFFDVVISLVFYLSTAVIGLYYWSDDLYFQLMSTGLILIYFIFLWNQVTIKNKTWTNQLRDEFDLRLLVSQIPNDVFELTDKVLPENEKLTVSELQAKIVKSLQESFQKKEAISFEMAKIDKMAAIGEMVSGIMHEINNPIAIITSRIQMLESKVKSGQIDSESLKKSLEIIARNAFRASKIIMGTKALVREANDENFVHSTYGEVLASALDMISEKIEKYEIRIESEFKNCEENSNMYCYPIQISQVLVNLISNSIDAIVNNKDRWIKFTFESDQAWNRIRVTDCGLGLSDSISKNIEKVFYTSKIVGEGTGLGLHITRKIVEAHKGKFYYNKESRNTEFVIEIPARQS